MITMAKQREGNERASVKSLGIVGGWKRLASDALSLAGLQIKLLQVDSSTWVRRARFAVLLLVAGAVLTVCAMPLVLLAGVVGLTMTGLHQVWALLIVGGAALLIGGILIAWAVRRLKHSSDSFDRSRSELDENVEWLREQFSGDSN